VNKKKTASGITPPAIFILRRHGPISQRAIL